jgi:hypothetical protein
MLFHCLNLRILFIVASLLISSLCIALPPKSKAPIQVFEKEDSEETFTAKVSVVREIQEEIEVFFEGNKKGPYILPDGPHHGLYMQRLEKSKKSSGPMVKVTIDNDRLQSVDIVEKKESEGPQVSEEDLMKKIYKDR